jgi:2-polyprenyl-3-methyl-5-hydroxy-6-metoxy-1,4-benzoquinol methylase
MYYLDKNKIYYGLVRREVVDFLPFKNGTILDIGCGNGATLMFLKDKGICGTAYGMELMPEPAAEAMEVLDKAWCGNIEETMPDIAMGTLDAILLMDVLEHLADPWAVVKKITPLLKPDGMLVASIPNVRHWSSLLPLVFANRWTYVESGILDKTHLRFFVKKTAIELMECSGLKVDKIQDMHRIKFRIWKPKNLVKNIGLLFFPNIMALQFYIRARKP